MAIKAKEFWDKFARSLIDTLSKYVQWPAVYNTLRPWTEDVMKPVCYKTGNALGFRTERENFQEYMRIDHGYFTIGQEDTSKEWCNWDWEVAIELENNYERNSANEWLWLEEFTRLSHLNAGLKVIITYIDYKAHGVDSCREVLKEAKKLYLQRKYKSINDNWLFIFGPRYKNLQTINNVDFRSFQWDGKTDFEELPSYRIIPSLSKR